CTDSVFLQAEVGIKDGQVTGVQTCALPILAARQEVEPLWAALGLGDAMAVGGPEGLDFLACGHEVDLVLTDLGMPVMPGSDVARDRKSGVLGKRGWWR